MAFPSVLLCAHHDWLPAGALSFSSAWARRQVFSQFKKDMDKNAKVVATLQKENLSLKKKSAKSDAALIEMVNEVRLPSGPVGMTVQPAAWRARGTHAALCTRVLVAYVGPGGLWRAVGSVRLQTDCCGRVMRVAAKCAQASDGEAEVGQRDAQGALAKAAGAVPVSAPGHPPSISLMACEPRGEHEPPALLQCGFLGGLSLTVCTGLGTATHRHDARCTMQEERDELRRNLGGASGKENAAPEAGSCGEDAASAPPVGVA
jgi:hypothetical protein